MKCILSDIKSDWINWLVYIIDTELKSEIIMKWKLIRWIIISTELRSDKEVNKFWGYISFKLI